MLKLNGVQEPLMEGKCKTTLRKYIVSIIVLSLNTLLLYFYYNSFAPILSMMAKDFGFTDEERDYKIGNCDYIVLISRKSL